MNRFNCFNLITRIGKLLLPLLLMLCSGCAVSARNHYIELENAAKTNYDDFNDIYCYESPKDFQFNICSGAYWSKSLSIGPLIPIIPQTNRDSRLAYDIKRNRIIEFKNISSSDTILLSQLGPIELCDNQYSELCENNQETISVPPLSSVWLLLSEGEKHAIKVAVGGKEYIAVLKTFSKKKWHMVSV